MIKKPFSLLTRTGIIVGITLFVFQMAAIISLIAFLLLPVVKSSAATMAAIMKTSADNWLNLHPQNRNIFIQEIKKYYSFDLRINVTNNNSTIRPHEPYLFYLEDVLSQQLNQEIRFYEDRDNHELFHAHFFYQNYNFTVTVPLHQLGGQPHAAFYTILFTGFVLTLISSWWLAHQLNKPINQLITVVKQVSQGISPANLPEEGCNELATLSKCFNTMAKKVEEFLENRTVMLAGISHDLRTPLTRMALSIEMLSEDSDPELKQQIRSDIVIMNEMIGYYMELARSLTEEKPEQINLQQFLAALIQPHQTASLTKIQLKKSDAEQLNKKIWLYPIALKRILNNLIENAISYGEGKPITITYNLVHQNNINQLTITITDQGPGIPEEEIEKVFRPFYRVEKSRNSEFGGNGLGLAIVKQLAEARGWTIRLKNQDAGGIAAILNINIT
jgi:two-component system osmolarity sensor histidine kinase EnvZ